MNPKRQLSVIIGAQVKKNSEKGRISPALSSWGDCHGSRKNPDRTVLDFLLCLDMLALIISGVMMSRHVFVFLGPRGNMAQPGRLPVCFDVHSASAAPPTSAPAMTPQKTCGKQRRSAQKPPEFWGFSHPGTAILTRCRLDAGKKVRAPSQQGRCASWIQRHAGAADRA